MTHKTNLDHWQQCEAWMTWGTKRRLGAGSRPDLVNQTLPAFFAFPFAPVWFLQNFHNLIVYNRREGWDVKASTGINWDSPKRLKTSSLGRLRGGPWNMLSSYSSALSTYLVGSEIINAKYWKSGVNKKLLTKSSSVHFQGISIQNLQTFRYHLAAVIVLKMSHIWMPCVPCMNWTIIHLNSFPSSFCMSLT